MKPLTGTRRSLESEFKESFSGKRVLVTGARGFIGTHVVHALLSLGAVVQAASRNWSGAINDAENLDQLSCDLTHLESTRELVAKSRPELILHLAATVTAQERMDLVVPTMNNIVVASVNLLMSATESDCQQFVAVATPEEPNMHASAASPYAAAKQCASIYFKLFYERYQLPMTIVKPFMTFGPGQESTKLVPHIVLSLLKNAPPLLSSGERELDFVYVEDVVRGILKASLAKAEPSQTIDLGSGSATSIRQVVEMVSKLVNSTAKPEFGAIKERSNTEVIVADLQSSKSLIDWSPSWTLEEGLTETIQWYRKSL